MVRNSYFQHLVRLLVLIGFAAGHLGFPMLELPIAISGASYPCDGHQCGCKSAHDCWNGCCCMPLRDRLAWAERHGVQPPTDLLIAVNESPSDCSSHGSCCSASSTKSDVHLSTEPIDLKREWMATLQSMKCRGYSTFWVASAEPALPVMLPEPMQIDLPWLDNVEMTDDHFTFFRTAPPSRPG